MEWVTGLVGVRSRNLREQADLLARLARPGADQARHRADVSVGRRTGAEGAGGKSVIAEVSEKRINIEWVKGAAVVQSRNLRQQTHLLAPLARPGADQAGDRADVSVDRGAGEEGAGRGGVSACKTELPTRRPYRDRSAGRDAAHCDLVG